MTIRDWNTAGIYGASTGMVSYGSSTERVISSIENPVDSGRDIILIDLILHALPGAGASSSEMFLNFTDALPDGGVEAPVGVYPPVDQAAPNAVGVVSINPTAAPLNQAKLMLWLINANTNGELWSPTTRMMNMFTLEPGNAIALFSPSLGNHAIGATWIWKENTRSE